MKKKILFLSALTAFAVGQTIAQTAEPRATSTIGESRVSWGIRAGVDFNNINGKYQDGSKMKNGLLPGFNAGVNLEMPIAPEFYLQPGILFRTSGSKLDNTAMNQPYKTEVHLSTLEIPVNFIYKPVLGTGRLIAGLGPYVDFGIAGKHTYSGTGAPADKDVKFQKTVSTNENTDFAYYRGFGAGGNLLFGYEFANRLSFQLNAQLGLTDIHPEYQSSPGMNKATKTGFGISAGYRF